MKIKRIVYVCCIFFLFFFQLSGEAKKKEVMLFAQKNDPADTIIRHVLDSVEVYSKKIDEYNADLYIKGKVSVFKRNNLLRYIPSMFTFEKGIKDYMTESLNEVHYTAPDIYDLKLKSMTGTFRHDRGKLGDVMQYFNMNVYKSTFLTDRLLSPLSEAGLKKYLYRLDSVWIEHDTRKYYKINVIPRYNSDKLIEGYIVVCNKDWTLSEMELKGRFDMVNFFTHIKMGKDGNAIFLPQHVFVRMLFGFLGNSLGGEYNAFFRYNLIRTSNVPRRSLWKKHSHDLSESFRLVCDSTRYVTKDLYMNFDRPVPLSDSENIIYMNSLLRKTQADKIPSKVKSKSSVFWGQIGDALISNYTINLSNVGSVRMSPLINPVMFKYSHGNGLSYRQVFKYNRVFDSDRILSIRPNLGYNFTRKEFYWRMVLDWNYWPEKIGIFHLDVGGGNRIYSSSVLDDIKQTPDSTFDFNKLKLDYFKDNYVKFSHEIEITNGLNVQVGFEAHHRIPMNVRIEETNVSKTNKDVVPHTDKSGQEILNKVRSSYDSFAPRVRIEWTPGLYYYMNRKRKMNLRSPFPSFSFDWERGLNGIFGSQGKYERFEVDMQHKISYPSMKKLYYRLGCGMYTNQEELYFVDYANFYQQNLISDNDDDVSGTFQLLDRRWFNSSSSYIRGHITYETPFLLFARLGKITRKIQHERLYLSMLSIPKLTPYIEVGYGIETHIFDLGVFANCIKGSFSSVGCSFSFELFR